MEEHKINKEIEKLKNDINIQKINRIARVSNIASIIIIPILFSLFILGVVRLDKLYQEIEDLENKKDSIQIVQNTLQFENSVLEKKKIQLETELMTTYGLTIDSITSLSTNEILEKSLLANNAIKSIVNEYQPNRNIVICYYNKTMIILPKFRATG